MLPINDVIHLGIIGLSQGCAYGLIALGFVLIYKATQNGIDSGVITTPPFPAEV